MVKFRKIKFIDHPILKNLELDFTDNNGRAVDTVIFAGENGTGKSTILEALYSVAAGASIKADLEFDVDGQMFEFAYKAMTASGSAFPIPAPQISNFLATMPFVQFRQNNGVKAIFSEVDINFRTKSINSVTSMTLDGAGGSKRGESDLATHINQLIVDIQAQDDAELAEAYRVAKEAGVSTDTISPAQKMPRFTNAFNSMFENLTYSKVENAGGSKRIVFKKYGEDVPIEHLSSGEKQVVYRGCFLLKDKDVLKGAMVFIDEPEISLHPLWQEKILDYYKGIFTDASGVQTSQMFVVTHSPFIVHNKNRKNDKVIVLTRDEEGKIVALDKPDYYRCESITVVEDAFNTNAFNVQDGSTIYLEGRTDEKYFNRALEVFGYRDVPFKFKWVGYLDERGQERNTGCDALNKAFEFVAAQNLPYRNIFLFDCDVKKKNREVNNAYQRVIGFRKENARFKKGIENALCVSFLGDVSEYYTASVIEGDYGEKKVIEEFDKMSFCDMVCSLEEATLKVVLSNVKAEIDKLIELYRR